MSQEQGAAAVIIALIHQKNKSRKKRQKGWKINNSWFYKPLLAELRLEEKYYYKNYLRMTPENFEELFQLIIGDITKGF